MITNEFIKKIKLPALLLIILIFPLYVGHHVPIEIKSFLFALSLSIKAILEFFLPFIIFSFVFSCLASLQKGAVFFVLLLISCVFLSNLTALMTGYSSGVLGLKILNMKETVLPVTTPLFPAWQFHLNKIISNDVALMFGFLLGMLLSIWPNTMAKKMSQRLSYIANTFLRKIFIPILPLFVLGFVFKLEHEQILQTSLTVYGPILILIIATQWLYLSFWYFIAGKCSVKQSINYLKNVLPASLTGLSTISSAASMPVLLISTEKNLNNTEQAKMLIPAIINIHTIGSAIAVPILSLATLSTFDMPIPSVSVFIVFALYTALAKFAVAAVPGGVIIVVAPLLEAHLGFSSAMTGLITAVYMICDPFGTAANVTGNGVFPILFTRLHTMLAKIHYPRLFQPNKSAKLNYSSELD